MQAEMRLALPEGTKRPSADAVTRSKPLLRQVRKVQPLMRYNTAMIRNGPNIKTLISQERRHSRGLLCNTCVQVLGFNRWKIKRRRAVRAHKPEVSTMNFRGGSRNVSQS